MTLDQLKQRVFSGSLQEIQSNSLHNQQQTLATKLRDFKQQASAANERRRLGGDASLTSPAGKLKPGPSIAHMLAMRVLEDQGRRGMREREGG